MFGLGAAQAQNGSANNNGNGNNIAAWIINAMQSTGQVPRPVAGMVLQDGRQAVQQAYSLNLGLAIHKYNLGDLTVDFVMTAPPSLTFRLRYGGGIIIIMDGN